MRVLAVQAAPVVGDVAGNTVLVLDGIARARAADARVVVFPELVLSGYPPRDLLDRPDFRGACRAAAERVAAATPPGLIVVYGCPWVDGGLRNSAIIATGGRIVAMRHKALLPAYDVFDEPRWFVPGSAQGPIEVDGLRLGVLVCEDAWNAPDFVPDRGYTADPVAALRGADLVVNLSASPFDVEKLALRHLVMAHQAVRIGAPYVYCNQLGSNDELVFDGASFACAPDGTIIAQAEPFDGVDLLVETDSRAPVSWTPAPPIERVRRALVWGTRDYASRCGFRTAVLGLSGGIDSAVVACIAAEALGAENVLAVGMPGPYSSEGSVSDARALADSLGCRWEMLPIGAGFDALKATLAPVLARTPRGTSDVTEENLQSRIRGTLLMGVSNREGRLLLTTGNKSEVAVGYCTIYGDMNGGLAPIADLWKTEVYALATHLNTTRARIPLSTITKPPSAELAPGQTDQDTLPPYAELDAILRLHVEDCLGPDAIVAYGHRQELVARVLGMVRRAEHKRWQAAPGLRVSPRAFGVGRRLPLANAWT